jgi:hypothetical protein
MERPRCSPRLTCSTDCQHVKIRLNPPWVEGRDHCNSILTQTRDLLKLPSMVSDISCTGVSFHPRFIFPWSQRYARAIRTDRGDGAGLRPCGDCANATISPVVRPPLHCFTGLFCPETMFSIRSANCHSGNAIHGWDSRSFPTDMLPILDCEPTGVIHPKTRQKPYGAPGIPEKGLGGAFRRRSEVN